MSNPEAIERSHDKVLEDTFPASDPPANSGITDAEPVDEAPQNPEEIPTGMPTSDRYNAETAHTSEPDPKPASKP